MKTKSSLLKLKKILKIEHNTINGVNNLSNVKK